MQYTTYSTQFCNRYLQKPIIYGKIHKKLLIAILYYITFQFWKCSTLYPTHGFSLLMIMIYSQIFRSIFWLTATQIHNDDIYLQSMRCVNLKKEEIEIFMYLYLSLSVCSKCAFYDIFDLELSLILLSYVVRELASIPIQSLSKQCELNLYYTSRVFIIKINFLD